MVVVAVVAEQAGEVVEEPLEAVELPVEVEEAAAWAPGEVPELSL